jgi:hypothetical protein
VAWNASTDAALRGFGDIKLECFKDVTSGSGGMVS